MAIQITNLRVNLQSFPSDVTDDARFSWWLTSDRDNDRQTAYQLRVAANGQPKPLAVTAWQRGHRNAGVPWPDLGPLLQPGQLYSWQVRIKNSQKEKSSWSTPAYFITALPHWSVPGIWAAPAQAGGDTLPATQAFAFLQSPMIDLDPAGYTKVVIRLASRGADSLLSQNVDLFLNGHAVGVGPARPQENIDGSGARAYHYNTYDVTAALVKHNQLALLATAADPQPSVHLAVIGYTVAGSIVTLAQTGPEWTGLDGTTAFGDDGTRLRTGYFAMPAENIDMAHYPRHWWHGTAANWPAAVVTRPSTVQDDERIMPYAAENSERQLIKNHTKVAEITPGNWLIDLGREIIGGLAVKLTSPAAQRVVVWQGEQLTADGHVRHHLAAGPDYISQWHLVSGKNHFLTAQMKNFRYVELRGFQGTLTPADIAGWQIAQPFPADDGRFHSNVPLLNAAYKLSRDTIAITNQDLFVDSQARERRAYEGDLLVNSLTSYTVSRNDALARYSIDYLLDHPTWPEDYKLFNVEMVWWDYLYTGDTALLTKRYAVLKAKLRRGPNNTDNYDPAMHLVRGTGLIDWPERERDGYVVGTYNTAFNAIYAGTYRIMAKIATLLGEQADMAHYENRALLVKKTLIDRLWDPAAGAFYDSLQADGTVTAHHAKHATAYALAYDVTDSPAMTAQMAKTVYNNGEFFGSIYFIYFILRGLIDHGYGALAENLLTNPDDRADQKTFAAILHTLRATVTPEAWSNQHKPNLTLSHPWGASPGLTIVQGLAGIMPLQAGGYRFSVRVQVTPGTTFQLTTPSSQGLIRLNYHEEGRTAVLALTVPMNAEAVVRTPKGPIAVDSGTHTVSYLRPVPLDGD